MFHKLFKKELVVKFVHIPYNRHNSEEENAKKFRSLVREIHNFRELKNESHIVKFYGFCVHEGQALICMELMDLSIKVRIALFFWDLVYFRGGQSRVKIEIFH